MTQPSPGDPAGSGGPPLLSIHLKGPEATAQLGFELGQRLRPGDAVALCGEMGAGKTTLVRSLAEGLGVEDPEEVSSPTWLVVLEHPGPIPLLHGDAWQPEKLRAFVEDGGGQYLHEGGGVLVLEWADRVADLLPEKCLWIRLRHGSGGDHRVAELTPSRRGDFAWAAELPILLGHG